MHVFINRSKRSNGEGIRGSFYSPSVCVTHIATISQDAIFACLVTRPKSKTEMQSQFLYSGTRIFVGTMNLFIITLRQEISISHSVMR